MGTRLWACVYGEWAIRAQGLRLLTVGGLADKEVWGLEPLEKSGERRGARRGEKEEVMVASPNIPASPPKPTPSVSARPWWRVTQATGWGT